MSNRTIFNQNHFQTSQIPLAIASPITSFGIAIIGILILNAYLQNLNGFIKRTLTILSFHNAICSLIGIVFSMVWWQDRNMITCSFMFVFMKSIFFITGESVTIISMIRYHLTKNTIQNKTYLIMGSTILIYVIEYFINIFLVLVRQPYPLAVCAHFVDVVEDQVSVYLIVLKSVIIYFIGIMYDFQTITYLIERNQRVEIQENPHCDPGRILDENETNYNLPIHATSAPLVGATTICVVGGVILRIRPDFEHFIIITYTFPCIFMPMMLALTLKATKSLTSESDGLAVELEQDFEKERSRKTSGKTVSLNLSSVKASTNDSSLHM